MNAPLIAVPDRTKFIGGSDVAAILGVSPWRNVVDLWMDKITPRREDGHNAAAKRRGSRLEPYILDMIREEYGLDIVAANERYIDAELPFLAAEIDAEYADGEARENIEIALAISGLSADLANDSLARLGVLEFADMVSGTLPEGVRKLLDIALAMVCKPEVLLLDEPTSGVAAEEKFDVMNRVLDAARGLGITVLFVEHDMEIVRRYSDRVLAFCDGRILADGTPDVVLSDAQVRELIIGETVAAVPGTAGVASEVAHA